MYPIKVTEFPAVLKRYAKKNKQLIRIGTKKGDNIMYLISESQKTSQLLRYLKTKKRLAFVYTPITLYKQTYPVVELIDIIE